MMTHEELEEAVPLYAVGALERPERQALEAHLLSGCVTCHATLKDYQGVAALLPFALQPVAPPDVLKARVLAAGNPLPPQFEDTKQTVKPSLEPGEWMNHIFPPIAPARSWPIQIAFALLTLLVLAGAAYFAWMTDARSTKEAGQLSDLHGRLQQETVKLGTLQKDIADRDEIVRQLREELAVRRTDLTELRDQLIQREAEIDDLRVQLAHRDTSPQQAGRQQDELTGLLKNPHAKVIMLMGTDQAKQAGAVFLFDSAGKKAWLYAFDLPDLPAGTVYQLWAIGEEPVSVGLFTLDAGRKGRLMIKGARNLSKMKHVAISIEPAGGRPYPTGPMYLISQTS
jgi:anti-sigma-K factor RskA